MLVIEISQIYLDLVSNTLTTGDFARYAQCMMLPLTLTSPHSQSVVTTEHELRAGFDRYLAALRSQQVTHLIRLAEQAEPIARDTITCDYVSHVLSNGHRAAPPHKSRMTLSLQGGVWRTSAINNAFFNSSLVDPRAPRPPPNLIQPLTITAMELT